MRTGAVETLYEWRGELGEETADLHDSVTTLRGELAKLLREAGTEADVGELAVLVGNLGGHPPSAAGDTGADRATAGGVLRQLASPWVLRRLRFARRHQPRGGIRQPLPEGGL
ncbi:MAG: hypothetical protein OXJ62_00565 [Spirochaetaceae bacterium]|nr:hypothetical protein [Spirochaetaceae bacterium]